MKVLTGIMVLFQIVSLGIVVATPATVSVEIGGVVELEVGIFDSEGNPISGEIVADFEVGGFEELEVVYGMEIYGRVKLHYIAPIEPGEYSVRFLSDDSSATVKIDVFIPEMEGEEATAQVVNFRGSVAYKRAGDDVWKPLESGQTLREGDSILALGNSYAVLRFPNESETRVLENTQLEIVELRRVGEGYSIVLKQYSGKTFSVVRKLLKIGERFLIETKSVTAGVRGTKFAVIEEKGGFEVEAFEGKVFTYMSDGRTFALPAGKGIKPDGRIVPATHSVEEFEPTEVGGEETKEGGETRVHPTSVFLGTVSTDDEKYLVYSFGMGFDFGPFGLDVGITAYSTEIGGEIFYGIPSTDPSTNVLDAFTINAVRLTLGPFKFRYGSAGIYTLGMGYTFRGYTTGIKRTLDIGYVTGGFWINVHLPYELKKISSFEISQSDSVYFGEIGMKIAELDTSVALIHDSNLSTSTEFEPIDYAVLVSLKREIFGFLNVGLELSGLHGIEGSTAYGAFAGLSGEVFIVNVFAGPYVNYGGFKAPVFSRSSVGGIRSDGSVEMGYMVGMEFSESWGEGRVYLSNDFEGSSILEGDLKFVLPRVVNFPGMEFSAGVYDPTPFEGIFDDDTEAWFTMATPMGEGGSIKVGTKFYWDGKSWKTDFFVSSGGSL